MPFAEIDGISTHYAIEGAGPPLLMFAPGGFDATMDKWRGFGVYQRINLMGHLPKHFQCILLTGAKTACLAGVSRRLAGPISSDRRLAFLIISGSTAPI